MVDGLEVLGLEDAASVATFDDEGVSREIFVRLINRHLPDADAGALTSALAAIGGAVAGGFRGRLQTLLREEAIALRDRLLERLQPDSDDEAIVNAFTLWLQNVAGAPIPLQTGTVAAYLKRHGATFEELVTAADDLGVNAALTTTSLLKRARISKRDGHNLV